MRKIRVKTAACIFAFCVVVSVVFAGVLLIFQKNSIDKFSQSNAGIYFLTDDDVISYANNGSFNIDNWDVVSTSDYNSQLFSQMYKQILPLVIGFFVFLFATSFILTVVIYKLQNKENQEVSEQLIKLQNGEEIVCENPALCKIYEEIENKFQSNLSDYKRLNSYLSHEQKNAVAILRTTLELDGQKDNIAMLDRVAASIDDVLTLSENKDISSVVKVDVSLVCAEVVDAYKKTYPKIIFDFPENENSEILAKERWIYRAVSNLIDNAIKYGEGKEIHVSVSVANYSVMVRIEDNGIGIIEEKQQKIFNDRYRINELNCDGYGIGLSLVSHVCDLCEGYVFVDSQIGAGSTFVLSFPQLC